MRYTPEYTLEQKAAAFDALWKNCGPGRGVLRDYVRRPISRTAKEAAFLRVPRYAFELLAEGDGMQQFSDVLHHLATRNGDQQRTTPEGAGHAIHATA